MGHTHTEIAVIVMAQVAKAIELLGGKAAFTLHHLPLQEASLLCPVSLG